MSEYFTGITFPQQKVTPSDDASIRRAMLADGVLSGCVLSYSGSTLTMTAGLMIACGREFRHTAAQNWAVVDANSGFARLLLTIDTTRTSSKEAFDQITDSIEYASSIDGFPELQQADINASGTIYQVVVCVVSLGAGGITGIVSQLGAGERFRPSTWLPTPEEIGAMPEMQLLWENASPESAFVAQLIPLDLSEYDIVLVEIKFSSFNIQRVTGFARKGQTTYIGTPVTVNAFRAVEVSDGGCSFADGYLVSTYTNATVNNERAIPTAIYGIKGVSA